MSIEYMGYIQLASFKRNLTVNGKSKQKLSKQKAGMKKEYPEQKKCACHMKFKPQMFKRSEPIQEKCHIHSETWTQLTGICNLQRLLQRIHDSSDENQFIDVRIQKATRQQTASTALVRFATIIFGCFKFDVSSVHFCSDYWRVAYALHLLFCITLLLAIDCV